jgi:hypothetical protein
MAHERLHAYAYAKQRHMAALRDTLEAAQVAREASEAAEWQAEIRRFRGQHDRAVRAAKARPAAVQVCVF